MPQNMGLIDRIIRVLFAVVVAVLYFTKMLTNPIAAIILGIFAVVFLITAILGFCPLYLPFGISTKKKSAKK